MITSREEYLNNLFRIQSESPPIILSPGVPAEEPMYEIDLNTRSIDAPKFLSVEKDHNAEVVYFVMDRFFDNLDLSSTVGIVQFINAEGKSGFYPIPFYDIDTLKSDNKIIIPWMIDGRATREAGDIKFAFCFYLLDGDKNYMFLLNTLPAKSKILYGMNLHETMDSPEFVLPAEELLYINQEIQSLKREFDMYWYDVD